VQPGPAAREPSEAGDPIAIRSPDATRYHWGVTERRRRLAIVVLFAIGFALVGLASLVDSTWPLFVTVVPYAAIPWLVVRADEPAGGA
jgi:hypothetical protein